MSTREVRLMTKPELMEKGPSRLLSVPSWALTPPFLDATPRKWLPSQRHSQDPGRPSNTDCRPQAVDSEGLGGLVSGDPMLGPRGHEPYSRGLRHLLQ